MEIKDGTAEFRVRDQRLKAMVDFFFPVGAIYTCVTKPTWMDEYGEWQEVGAGRVLWGADDIHKAGTEIEAGLPNITGGIVINGDVNTARITGAFYPEPNRSERGANENESGRIVHFDASKSNSIYGASDTVQPPAYVVTFWKRIE